MSQPQTLFSQKAMALWQPTNSSHVSYHDPLFLSLYIYTEREREIEWVWRSVPTCGNWCANCYLSLSSDKKPKLSKATKTRRNKQHTRTKEQLNSSTAAKVVEYTYCECYLWFPSTQTLLKIFTFWTPSSTWRIRIRRSENPIPLPSPGRAGPTRSTTSFSKLFSCMCFSLSLSLIHDRFMVLEFVFVVGFVNELTRIVWMMLCLCFCVWVNFGFWVMQCDFYCSVDPFSFGLCFRFIFHLRGLKFSSFLLFVCFLLIFVFLRVAPDWFQIRPWLEEDWSICRFQNSYPGNFINVRNVWKMTIRHLFFVS